VRGAFTGAVGNRQGRLEQSHKGTLFLDEVGTMSAGLQMKLLRVLQEREFERLGDTHSIKVDVRVVAATNSDLKKMVAEGQFREDLFYRLNVIPIELPPLRDRKEDIPLLVQHFLKKFSAPDLHAQATEARAQSQRPDHGRNTEPAGRTLTISQQAMRALMAYSWPGNVRQLENAIERAVALSGGRTQIETADLTPEIQQASESTRRSPPMVMRSCAWAGCGANKAQALAAGDPAAQHGFSRAAVSCSRKLFDRSVAKGVFSRGSRGLPAQGIRLEVRSTEAERRSHRAAARPRTASQGAA